MNDLREKIHELKSFDRREEINNYCDDLVSQVVLAAESAHKHLENSQMLLISEIDAYRARLLESLFPRVSSPRVRDPLSKIDKWTEDDAVYTGELERLINEIVNLEKKLMEANNTLSDRDAIEADVSDYKMRLKSAAEGMRKLTFNNNFMVFNCNRLLSLNQDLIGHFTFVKHDRLNSRVQVELKAAIQAKCDKVLRAGFFSDELIQVHADKAQNFLWDHHKGESHILFWDKLPSIACLQNHYAVIGSASGHVRILDWKNYTVNEYYKIHKDVIVSVKILPNETVVSCSKDGHLIIWNPHLKPDKRVFLTLQAEAEMICHQLELLSNGFLVTLHSNDCKSVLNVWSPNSGRLIKRIETNLSNNTSIFVLHDDMIALGSCGCEIHILDLISASVTNILTLNEKNLRITTFAELPNGLIIAGIAEYSHFYVWNREYSRPCQIIRTDLCKSFVSIDVSRDGRFLVSSSEDAFVRLWSLSVY